jgi:hypothetical protein
MFRAKTNGMINGMIVSGWFSLTIVLLISLTPATACGQGKYYPDHDEVTAIVKKGISYLRANPPKADVGELTLTALAIVQAQKRYYQEVPKDDPIVKMAIEEVLKELKADPPARLHDRNEVYVPVMATILLAEVDKVKYKQEIAALVDGIQKRVLPHGGINYMNQEKNVGDTSQLQYAALALYVANVHGFSVDPEIVKKMLSWLVASQQSSGLYYYKLRSQGSQGNNWSPIAESPNSRPSIHAGGLGTVYLMADMLRLFPRRKSMTNIASQEQFLDLPKTVMVYIPPIDGGENKFNQDGPVVKFETGKLMSCVGSGNRALESMYTIDTPEWNYYYLYALERYAWFREQAEGDITGGKIARWYDDGVEFLKKMQEPDGAFQKSDFTFENKAVSTSFAILFLVRSSEVLSLPNAESETIGGLGFTDGILDVRGANIIGGNPEKDINSMMKMLQEEPTEEQLETLSQSMKAAIEEFNKMPDKSRSEIKSFLRTMIMADNDIRVKIAVRFLAAEQDMDNVPALIYALGDPNFEICLEAHDGLRLISRRIDSINLSETTRRKSEDPYSVTAADIPSMRSEFNDVKRKWTEWYLKIRPNAELFD